MIASFFVGLDEVCQFEDHSSGPIGLNFFLVASFRILRAADPASRRLLY